MQPFLLKLTRKINKNFLGLFRLYSSYFCFSPFEHFPAILLYYSYNLSNFIKNHIILYMRYGVYFLVIIYLVNY